MTAIARRVGIRGLVQGVGFRYHTLDRARTLGLVGWVRNRLDGTVEAWVQGDEARVAEMLAWLKGGPRAARVERLDVDEETPGAFVTFEIRRGHLSAS
ncbi:MAG: acylphosphatase [Planctomycetes bacterium]|nr:acylphosphatase [Planctomycetota bacterium]